MTQTYTELIRELFESDRTSYSIARDSGMTTQFVDNYRKKVNPSKIENMSLKNAEALITYINNEMEMEIMKNIKNLSVEEFYNLDEVSIESDGFYYVDEENDVSEMVPTPEEALLPEEEWNGEDYTNHLHPAYLPAWKELQDKVVEAYENMG